jgi:hypothetical protein
VALPNLSTPYPGSGTATDYCDAKVQFPVRRAVKQPVELTVFEDYSTQARKITNVKGQSYELSYASQSDAERASFEAFHDARQGPYQTFYFNDVRYGVNDILVRFSDGDVKYSADGPRTWSWNVKIIVVTS